MIQRTVTVKSAVFKDTKDGKKQYLSAVLSDGNKDSTQSVFDPELQKILQEAAKSGERLDIGLEKEGQFWNLKTAVVSSGKKATPEAHGTYSQKDNDILLSVAFKGAVELDIQHIVPEGKVDTGRVLQETSELFAGLVLMRPKSEADNA